MKLEFTTGCTEYRTHLGLPYRWQDEATGDLPRAIKRYLDYMLQERQFLSQRDFDLVVDYMKHFINAPCWQEDQDMLLTVVRRRVDQLRTPTDIDSWIKQCMLIGLDPL